MQILRMRSPKYQASLVLCPSCAHLILSRDSSKKVKPPEYTISKQERIHANPSPVIDKVSGVPCAAKSSTSCGMALQSEAYIYVSSRPHKRWGRFVSFNFLSLSSIDARNQLNVCIHWLHTAVHSCYYSDHLRFDLWWMWLFMMIITFVVVTMGILINLFRCWYCPLIDNGNQSKWSRFHFNLFRQKIAEWVTLLISRMFCRMRHWTKWYKLRVNRAAWFKLNITMYCNMWCDDNLIAAVIQEAAGIVRARAPRHPVFALTHCSLRLVLWWQLGNSRHSAGSRHSPCARPELALTHFFCTW